VRAWTSGPTVAAERIMNLADPATELPGRLGLSPEDSSRESPVTVEATALKKGSIVLTRKAALSFLPGEVHLLVLDLRAECLCRAPCPTDTTCGEGGQCQPITKDPHTLPRYQPRADAGVRTARPSVGCVPPDGGADGGSEGFDAGAGSDARAEIDGDGTPDAGADDATTVVPPMSDASTVAPDAPTVAPDARADTATIAPDASPDHPAPPIDAPAKPDVGLTPDTQPPPPDARPPDVTVGRPVGDGCNVDGDCANRLCVDNVCCQSACAAPCMACARSKTGASDGTCAPVTAGSDKDDDCAAGDADHCGYDGFCDGHGACRFYGPDTRCGPPTCNISSYAPPRFCSGDGLCVPATPRDCGHYVCSLSGCLKTCADDDACEPTSYCANGSCAGQQGIGNICTRPRECLKGCLLGLCL
jgi:hypothetical protein